MQDKVAAARRIDEYLKNLLANGAFRLKYRITVNPPKSEIAGLDSPEILVEFAGPDSPLLLERNAELLRSFEHLALKLIRLDEEDHHRISFDCQNFKANRLQELTLAADHAAEWVRKTGMPYQFSPMSGRERRIIHVTLSQQADLRTESTGVGPERALVVYPRDYDPSKHQPKPGSGIMRRRR